MNKATLSHNTPKPKKFSKSKFTPIDDYRLRELISIHGTMDWELIAAHMINRNARQCREHWEYYLSPSVNNGPWSEEEDKLLFEKYAEYGSKWKEIAKFFQKRTNTNVKNRWLLLQRIAEKEMKLQSIHERSSSIDNIPVLDDYSNTSFLTETTQFITDPFDPIFAMAQNEADGLFDLKL